MQITRDFERQLQSRLLQGGNLIQAVLGPRQVGKTTGVLRVCEQWAGPVTYASADLPAPPSANWILEQWQSARLKGANGLLVLDEVQKVPHWSDIVKALYDEERRRQGQLQVVILGSASWLLQSGLNDTLAGRFEILPVRHWSAYESAQLADWKPETFLKYGGYPIGTALIDDDERWQRFVRDSIIEPVLSRDVFGMRTVSKPALLRQTFELAVKYPAQEISIQKLLGQLQDRGNATTIKGYLELLRAGFVLAVLEKYSTRPITTKSSSPKLVPLCPALIHAFTSPSRFDLDPEWRGRVVEAAVGAALCRTFPDIWYWRERDHEVDFVVRHQSTLLAIEVKSGRKKGSRGLTEFLKKFDGATPIVLSMESCLKLLSAEDVRQTLLTMVG